MIARIPVLTINSGKVGSYVIKTVQIKLFLQKRGYKLRQKKKYFLVLFLLKLMKIVLLSLSLWVELRTNFTN